MQNYLILLFSLLLFACSHQEKKIIKKDFAVQKSETILAKYAHMRLHPELYPVPEQPKINRSKMLKQNNKPNTQIQDPKEISIELEQNLAYFCIKNSQLKNCEEYTKTKLLECEVKKIDTPNLDLLKCVKEKL